MAEASTSRRPQFIPAAQASEPGDPPIEDGGGGGSGGFGSGGSGGFGSGGGGSGGGSSGGSSGFGGGGSGGGGSGGFGSSGGAGGSSIAGSSGSGGSWGSSGGVGSSVGSGGSFSDVTSVKSNGKTNVFTKDDGTTITVTGNRPTRDNNPLDINYGSWAQAHGAIGSEGAGGRNGHGRFAIFASPKDGYKAGLENLDRINNKLGGHGTISQLVNTASPVQDGNNPQQIINDIQAGTGLAGSTQWSDVTASQRDAAIQIYGKDEGFGKH